MPATPVFRALLATPDFDVSHERHRKQQLESLFQRTHQDERDIAELVLTHRRHCRSIQKLRADQRDRPRKTHEMMSLVVAHAREFEKVAGTELAAPHMVWCELITSEFRFFEV
eukprot:GABV01002664.1.p1 GENE.GABV01002664.1~~GABV01002664.1.p1  ORF type:complete len:120 (+),score=52.11 GABV01002664.1:23-361(+)